MSAWELQRFFLTTIGFGQRLPDTYADRILAVTATEEVHNRIQVALAMLGDLKNLLSVTEHFPQMHVSGDPRDVFHSEEDI